MPTRNISLTPEQDAFIEKTVKSANTRMPAKPCAMRCARCNSAGAKTCSSSRRCGWQIKAGVDALDRGEVTEVADADLDRYPQGLTATAGKRVR